MKRTDFEYRHVYIYVYPSMDLETANYVWKKTFLFFFPLRTETLSLFFFSFLTFAH